MVSTGTVFALNKRRLSRKSVSTRRNEDSIKYLFPLAGKTTSAVRNKKTRRKLFTPNFKHCIHQQKRAPNKSTKLVINQKSLSTSQNEGFLEKCDFTVPKSYFHSSQYLVINRKSVSTSQNEGFLEKCDFTVLKSYFHSSHCKYWPPCNCNNGF